MPSKPEIRRIVEGYAQSGMTRREYCQKHNIPITTLDYWRRRMQKSKPRLVEIAVEAAQNTPWLSITSRTAGIRVRVPSSSTSRA